MNNLDLYKCEVCGNIVEVISAGFGELTCCGQAMKKLEGKKSENAMMEKHVPIIEKDENGDYEIRVGEVLHPMTDEHYIMFIETISKDKSKARIKYLTPADEPKIHISEMSEDMLVRAYCNIHGLWESNFNVL